MSNTNAKTLNSKKAEVIAKGKEVEANLRRDLPELEKYNVSETDIDDFKSLVDAADNSQTDEIAVNKQVVATAAKNDAKDALCSELKGIGMILLSYFKGNSDEQRLFALKDLSRMSDAKMANAALSYINLLNENPDTLKAANIGKANMDSLSAAYNAYVANKATAVQAKRERKEATIAGSKSLTDLVQHMTYLCQIAKHCWAQQGDSRYNDYVLYRQSKSTASPPAPATQPTATTSQPETPNTAATEKGAA